MSELKQFYIEDLSVGMCEVLERKVTDDDIRAFADVSGDHNPIHLDAEAAARTIFKERIAHGMLTASMFSTVIGTRMPGTGTVYLSQTLRFKAPVRIDDEVIASVTVTSIDAERRRVDLDCSCTVRGKVVLEGEACVMVPARG